MGVVSPCSAISMYLSDVPMDILLHAADPAAIRYPIPEHANAAEESPRKGSTPSCRSSASLDAATPSSFAISPTVWTHLKTPELFQNPHDLKLTSVLGCT